MLIPFKELCLKYRLKITGIIHLGAHLLEERGDYENEGISNVIWVEGNPEIYQQGLKLLKDYKNHQLYNYLIADKDGAEVTFNIANSSQSSSIFEFDKHKEYHPDIEYVGKIVLKTATMKSILSENNIDIGNYNFLNLDLQGAELLALKSFGDLLNHIEFIYTEVNVASTYIDNPFLNEIDEYLSIFGFRRYELQLAGDAGRAAQAAGCAVPASGTAVPRA